MPNTELIEFVRAHPWGVIATAGPYGAPQAALVGIAVSDRGEVLFDSSPAARKVNNLARDERAALVVIAFEEITLQCEGTAEVVPAADHDRCLAAYLAAYPDGRQRADDGATLLRFTPRWARIADFRPDSFGVHELELDGARPGLHP